MDILSNQKNFTVELFSMRGYGLIEQPSYNQSICAWYFKSE